MAMIHSKQNGRGANGNTLRISYTGSVPIPAPSEFADHNGHIPLDVVINAIESVSNFGGGAAVAVVGGYSFDTGLWEMDEQGGLRLPTELSYYEDQAVVYDTTSPAIVGTASLAGSGAEFTLVRENGTSYSVLEVTNSGLGYVVGETITYLGSDLGGASPANDLVITVDSIGLSGEILTVSAAGTAVSVSSVLIGAENCLVTVRGHLVWGNIHKNSY